MRHVRDCWARCVRWCVLGWVILFTSITSAGNGAQENYISTKIFSTLRHEKRRKPSSKNVVGLLSLIISRTQLCFKATNYAKMIYATCSAQPMKLKENRFELQHSTSHVGLPSSAYYVVILTEFEPQFPNYSNYPDHQCKLTCNSLLLKVRQKCH